MDKKEQNELIIQNELLKAIAEQNHEKILEYDARTDRAVIYTVANGQFVTMYDMPDYVAGGKIGSYGIDPEDIAAYRRAVKTCLKKATHTIVDARFIEQGKPAEWHRFYLVSVLGEDGKVEKLVGRFLSIHNEKLVNERIRKRAEIDVLTNVYNHKAFEELCGKEIPKRKDGSLFLMLDVDDFKIVNDTQGHVVGDMVLSQTGAILNSAVGTNGLVGRLGGDEFAAFVWGFADRQEMEQFCIDLQRALKTIIFDMEYSASVGIAVTGGRELTFHDLYYEADQAVYAVKNEGKGHVIFFDEIKETAEAEPVKVQAEQLPDAGAGNEMLKELQYCIKSLSTVCFEDALFRTLESLREYFDADMAGLVFHPDEERVCLKETARESANMLERIVEDAVESGAIKNYEEMMFKRGYVVIPQVKAIKEEDPFLYAKLADCRIWSLAAMALREGEYQVGTLFVFNPHKRMEETALLTMVAEVLTTKILRQNLVERHEFEHTHDVLTNLWNRRSFSSWFWKNQETKYDALGVVTTDVIHLSDINKQLGYENGDKSLMEVAEILKNTFETYLIFRYDEDEMLVICPNVGKQDMELLADCLRERLAELGVAVAMGYAWSTNPDLRSMITESEKVMDNDKLKLLHGETAATLMAKSVISEVEELMATGHYLVYLQPKVNLHTGKTEGAEALIRQLDDVLGVVGPGMFIPVLEHYNLVHMIDLYVLKEVFRYQQEAIAQGRETVPISVNFSKMTIMYPEIVEKVCQLKAQYDIPDGLIQIEVTETIGDMDHVVIENVANSLKALGFKLSMDDFGSHYSNLPVLIHYDFDSAKIDRSMVMEITENPKSRLLIEYMTSMINDLGIQCVVEGVETKEQVDILKETKAEMIQGFYFGKPVPKDEFYDTFVNEK